MPLAALSLPKEGGGRTALSDFEGSALLLVYYDPQVPATRALFEGLAAQRDQLQKTAAKVLPVQLPGTGAAPAWLSELGFEEHALRAAKNDEQVLQALMIEVFAAYPALDLPLSLLCDSGGNLSVIHFASSSPERILHDLRKLKYARPEEVSSTSISGGRWLRRPSRQFGELSRVLQMLGARELARDFAQRARKD